MSNTCFGCIKLNSRPDAAGGGLYFCRDYPGLVLGEWGHWMSRPDEPKPLSENCYTVLEAGDKE